MPFTQSIWCETWQAASQALRQIAKQANRAKSTLAPMRLFRLVVFLAAIAGVRLAGALPDAQEFPRDTNGFRPGSEAHSIHSDSAEISLAGKARIEGLERLFFSDRGSQDTIRSLDPNIAKLLPLSARGEIGKIVPSARRSWASLPCSGDSGSDWWVVQADHRIPDVFPGHRLMLREAGIHAYVLQEKPIYLALYDNDRRVRVWSYSGAAGRALPDYRIHEVLADGEGRVKIRLEGSLSRKRFWEVKGVELGFQRKGDALVLESVLSPFTFLSGGEVWTESISQGRIVTRTIQALSRKELAACRILNPALDDDWSFDWQKLTRSANCATGRKRAKRESQSLGTPSFIEAGWHAEEK